MIKAITRMAVRPDKTEEFERLARELVCCSRKDDGSEYYSCNKSETQPNTYCFIEFCETQRLFTPAWTGSIFPACSRSWSG